MKLYFVKYENNKWEFCCSFRNLCKLDFIENTKCVERISWFRYINDISFSKKIWKIRYVK